MSAQCNTLPGLLRLRCCKFQCITQSDYGTLKIIAGLVFIRRRERVGKIHLGTSSVIDDAFSSIVGNHHRVIRIQLPHNVSNIGQCAGQTPAAFRFIGDHVTKNIAVKHIILHGFPHQSFVFFGEIAALKIDPAGKASPLGSTVDAADIFGRICKPHTGRSSGRAEHTGPLKYGQKTLFFATPVTIFIAPDLALAERQFIQRSNALAQFAAIDKYFHGRFGQTGGRKSHPPGAFKFLGQQYLRIIFTPDPHRDRSGSQFGSRQIDLAIQHYLLQIHAAVNGVPVRRFQQTYFKRRRLQIQRTPLPFIQLPGNSVAHIEIITVSAAFRQLNIFENFFARFQRQNFYHCRSGIIP